MREDINFYKKKQADKTYSLNEKQQLNEKEEADARLKERDKERLASGEPQEKTYELSLKQAALPGLPPALTKTNALTKIAGSKAGSLSGVSTNGNIAARDSAQPTLDEAQDEDKPPAVDADLLESERIMLDYISLVTKNNVASMVR